MFAERLSHITAIAAFIRLNLGVEWIIPFRIPRTRLRLMITTVGKREDMHHFYQTDLRQP